MPIHANFFGGRYWPIK